MTTIINSCWHAPDRRPLKNKADRPVNIMQSLLKSHEVTALVSTGEEYSVFCEKILRQLRNVRMKWVEP